MSINLENVIHDYKFDFADISFRSFAESSNDLIEILDPDCRRVYLNPANRSLFRDPEIMLGTRPYDDITMLNAGRLRSLLKDVLMTGMPGYDLFERLSPDNQKKTYGVQVNIIRDEKEDPLYLVMTSREITFNQGDKNILKILYTQLEDAEEIGLIGSWEHNFMENVITFSENFARIWGIQGNRKSMTQEEIVSYIHKDDRERVANISKHATYYKNIFDTRFRIVRPDKTERYVHSRWRLDRNSNNERLYSVGVCQDITNLEKSERTAFTIEEHFRILVEYAQDIAIFFLDPDGYVSSWNKGAERIKGYDKNEILGRHYSCFYPQEPERITKCSRQLAIAAESGKFESEGWRVRKDGGKFWARVVISRVIDKDGKLIGFMKFIHDMTKQLCTEDILRAHTDRIQANAMRLVELQESERRHLSRELHDIIGPKLTSLGINLQLIRKNLSGDSLEKSSEILKDSISHVHNTVDAIRYIIGELRPHAIDDFGLRSALRTHIGQFMKISGIKVNLQEENLPQDLPDLIKLSLYRIILEALNNVAKHSRATIVNISILVRDNTIRLKIVDNGIGFKKETIENMRTNENGIGLLTMRERAEAIGASFDLNTDVNRGVEIILELRLQVV